MAEATMAVEMMAVEMMAVETEATATTASCADDGRRANTASDTAPCRPSAAAAT